MGDKSPMYKPFSTNIASIEKTGPDSMRFKLKEPNASFLISTVAKINIIPKHVWEPVLTGLAGKPENAEIVPGAAAHRLGSIQGGALQAQRGDRAGEARGPLVRSEDGPLDLRIVPNNEAASACCVAAS